MKTNEPSALLQKRQGIRLWFEFLKLAHEDPRPDVKRALTTQTKFYEPWGDVRGMKFDKWWKEHSGLFMESEKLERLTEPPGALNPRCLYLAIPFGRSLTRTMADIRPLIASALKQDQNLAKKHKTRIGAKYRLTEDSEVRTRTLEENLVVYRDVYLKSPTPRRINERLLQRVHAYYEARKRSKRIPSQFGASLDLKRGSSAALDSHLRTLRRGIKRAERLVLNAARGDFPGRGT